MKKTTLSLWFSFLIIGNASAQFKISSANNIGIGADPITAAQFYILAPNNIYYACTAINATAVAQYNPGFQIQVGQTASLAYASFLGTSLKSYIWGSGTMWVYGSYTSGSDIRYKRNIEKITSPLEKITKLSGITYNLKDEWKSLGSQNISGENSRDKTKGEGKAEDFNSFPKTNVSDETAKQIQEESKRKKIGLIAQEVEKIVPEVISTNLDGYKAIAYSELVPLLIEGIKEQQTQIEQLKEQVATLNSSSSGEKQLNKSSGLEMSVTKPQLYQNAPNPFNTETTIKFFIPKTVKKAKIYVFNTEGKKNKTIDIDVKGESSVKIGANELTKGLYFYSLILDDQIFDSKTMLITE